ncbi:hypothetical protein ACLM5H_15820 [Fredinandcohnia humi]
MRLKSRDFMQGFSNKKQDKLVQFAKVDPNYTSGRPSLIFDGESIVTIKKYPYIASYEPAPNDRVMLIKGVIQGNIV